MKLTLPDLLEGKIHRAFILHPLSSGDLCRQVFSVLILLCAEPTV